MSTVTLTVPGQLRGTVQTEYGTYTIGADGTVTVDARLAPELIKNYSWSAADLPDIGPFAPAMATVQLPEIAGGHLKTHQLDLTVDPAGLVTVPRASVTALIRRGFKAGSSSPIIRPMLTPLILAMNGKGSGASDDGIVSRDLARHGEWVVTDGPAPYTAVPAANMDFDKFFPTSFPAGVTGVLLKMWDGAYIGPIGSFTWTIDPRFTVSIQTADPDVLFTTTAAGRGTLTIQGQPRGTGFSLVVTGPFASIAPSERGLRILPTADAHPERLYSDGLGRMMSEYGLRGYRPMEDWRTNYSDDFLTAMLVDRGGKTGYTSAPLETLVQLANDYDSDLHICLRYGLPLSYTSGIAVYIAANLKKGLGCKLEYGNEPWNKVFAMSLWLFHQGWVLGHANDADTGVVQPACVGWTTTSLNPNSYNNGGWAQPFIGNYDPGSTGSYRGQTTQALTAGTYILGGIYGYGPNVWRVTNDVPSGTVFPSAGDANFTVVATSAELEQGKWRVYSDQLQAHYGTALPIWTAAGHDPLKLRPALNQQSGPGLGYEPLILGRNNNALWKTPFSAMIAPYFYGINGDAGSDPLNKMIDRSTALDKADIEAKQHWIRDRRAALQAACPAGITPPGPLCCEIYEWASHSTFYGTDSPTKLIAYRAGRSLGVNFNYALTLMARDNPGIMVNIFASVTGPNPNAHNAWGVNFWAGEAGSGMETNPTGIALKDWFNAAKNGIPCADILCPLSPDEGPFNVDIMFGPQIDTAISGVLRVTAGTATGADVTGGLPLDIPFTKAAGSPVATVTVPVIDDTLFEPNETIILNILPQPAKFTVGNLSKNVEVTIVNNDSGALTNFPLPGNVIATYDASTITDGVDGAYYSSWMNVEGGLPATGSGTTRPKFKANVAGGKPALHFASSVLQIGTPPALITPLQSNSHSMVVIFKNIEGGSGDFGTLICDKYGNIFMGANASNAQYGNIRRTFDRTPDKVHVLVRTFDPVVNGRFYVDGTMAFGADGYGKADGTAPLCIGNDAGVNFGPTGADILEVRFLNATLTPAHAQQVQQYAMEKWGEPSPLAGLTEFPVFEGDSQTNGTGDVPDAAYPAQLAANKGWKMGQFANVGKPSANVGGAPGDQNNNLMYNAQKDVDGFKAVTGLPIKLIVGEYYNRGIAGGVAGDAQQWFDQNAAYNDARRAADPTITIIWWTSLASYNREGAARDAYNVGLVANKYGADIVIPIHTNANVGVNGAAGTTGAANTKFADGVHTIRSGSADVATVIGAAI